MALPRRDAPLRRLFGRADRDFSRSHGLQREADQKPDSGEFIDVLSLPLHEALEAVRSGEITDAKTITGLFWAEKAILAGW
jgi:hypothetical protein